MKVELKTKRYFTCPNGCAHEMAVEHLLGSGSCGVTKEHPTRQAGPWYCDGCGQGWNLTYTVDSVDVEPAKEKKVDQWIILELPPQTVPVRFKVRGSWWDRDIDESADAYFYEEHTCPTNWLRRVEEVSVAGDDDPHGLWKHVATYDVDAAAPCMGAAPGGPK